MVNDAAGPIEAESGGPDEPAVAVGESAGSTVATCQPVPDGPAVRDPPSTSTRSRIPVSPCPPPGIRSALAEEEPGEEKAEEEEEEEEGPGEEETG
ncbi:hypothetical protein GCM10023107_17060 [Actinoplanes octamycinicus]